MNHTVYVISNKPERFPPIVESLKPQRVQYFDGSEFPSFSKLVNSCVEICPTEIVIMVNHKTMPTYKHIIKTVNLLEKGYAFVGLCNFRFFGFKKELFRRIGPFDERYVGGGFEDYDFTVRLVEANLAAYFTSEVPLSHEPSSWGDYSRAGNFWPVKWKHTWEEGNSVPVSFERTMPEEKYNYKFGEPTNINFLSKEHTYTWNDPHIVPFFYKTKII